MAAMRIAIAGSSGLIGKPLVRALRADGHDVVRIVRRAARGADEARWDPVAGTVDPDALRGVDAVVNLAGAGIGAKRWTAAYKRELRDSRVLGTAALARAIAAAETPPRVFLAGSAVGYYGDTGDRTVDETAPSGEGFLADLCVDWEAATRPAEEAGVRVVHLRTGLVVTAEGGAWGPLMRAFRFGVGGRLGSGRQYWSFISLRDTIGAIRFLLDAEDVRGPVNLTAPEPVTNAEATKAVSRALRRPAMLPVPAFALRAVLGGLAVDVLSGRRAVPGVLRRAGFDFADPTIDQALAAALRD
ncbi:TIGR01777 family oxidoreductase [Yinghuangia sp. ASG 101]|uniref:TIGR01777 family oxidoreductase n=1 Tax=Yinghuangia sp. ASG 101 TaxID=2896848 RepID=UPI001E52A6E7|nr:TIGR01777 family oxidoreductase [Yinghuangia sp. ASG 101]UGQ09957.1 TIGR01777 family oxidoreductase [Yinghuangia sp. ASG 101]